ncbi:hypothetical protein [Salipaludibacillus aurantiacus]|uniref:Uncharacterized protein n=1 Tax=Salipaludibacillus aurantiacus TaxID=1601833 RepID=A0A1H9U8D7_9BACI|nr:hypothetical protein [Salipaludibacillus aurantiacus]SES05414.1 hypothetical protein SAMN05518684_10719 [Salipaludibacillus aurantiacus]
MKNIKKAFTLFCAVMMLSLAFIPGGTTLANNNATLNFSSEALEALEKSVYVNTLTRTAHVDNERALNYYEFTNDELELIQNELDNLNDYQIQAMIDHATANSEDEMQPLVAPAIVWGGIAVLGIFTGAALYFSSKYMNHVEKQNLINRCYDMGGTPSIDSGDTGGLHGAPKKAWWKMSNTYSFECVK